MESSQHQAPPAGDENPLSGTNPTDRNFRRADEEEKKEQKRGDKEPAQKPIVPGTGINDNRNAHEYTDINKSGSKDTQHPEEKDITV